MPANLVSAVVVGRLLEDRFRLERRDAFLYALAPQLAGVSEAPALALSIALGRRNEPPPPVVDDTGDDSDRSPSDREIPEGERTDVPDVRQMPYERAVETLRKYELRPDSQGRTSGVVESQEPQAGAVVRRGSSVVITLRPEKK